MVKMRLATDKALLSAIKRKELLTEDELVAQIGNRQWVSYAIKTGRVFSVQARAVASGTLLRGDDISVIL